jgi:hypothetical protein
LVFHRLHKAFLFKLSLILNAIQTGFFRRICAAARSVTAKRKRNKQARAFEGDGFMP